MSREPNPMYMFSTVEKRFLMEEYHRASSLSPTIQFGTINFNIVKKWSPHLLEMRDVFGINPQEPVERLIIQATFPTTIKVPHHINEDGVVEFKPDRRGAIRTYFDGAHISGLGHAVAIDIDHGSQTVTTQCPHGYDLPLMGEDIIQGSFPEYERVTLRAKQQQDSHSCAVITLHNMFAMAGIHEQQEEINTQVWRSELLDRLEGYEDPAPLTAVDKVMAFGVSDPVFYKRYR